MKISTSLIACILIAPSVTAQEREGGPPKHKGKRPEHARNIDFVKHHDSDSDGKVSREEFAKAKRASQLSEEAREKIFVRLDKNGDGFITSKDLKSAENDRFDHFLERADQDRDKRVSREEFLKNPPFGQAADARLNKMFAHMDQNSDGFLDSQDRRQGRGRMRPLGERRFAMLNFKELDTDKSGSISWREFQKSSTMKNLPGKERRVVFEKIDADNDEAITGNELKSHSEKHMPKKPRRPVPKK